MATRCYFPSSGAAPITVSYGSGWNKTSQSWGKFKGVVGTPSGTPMLGIADLVLLSSVTNPEHHCGAQFVYGPLSAQTVSGGVGKGQIRCRENNASYNGVRAIVSRIVTSAGATRFDLIGPTPAAPVTLDVTPPELSTSGTPANGRFQNSAEGTTLAYSGGSVSEGDFLVIEVGLKDHDSGTTRSGYMVIGDDGASDLTEGGTGLETTSNPWFEFAHTFIFAIADLRWKTFFPDMFPFKRRVVEY
jgi:hypothetical protein